MPLISDSLKTKTNNEAVSIRFVSGTDTLSDKEQSLATVHGFKGKAGECLLVTGADGALDYVLSGSDEDLTIWSAAHLPNKLPEGTYAFTDVSAKDEAALSLGWALAQYDFGAYKSADGKNVRTLECAGDIAESLLIAEAIARTRDLVNTPAEDMGPADLQDVAESIAEDCDATIATIVGDDLLAENFPAIHAVGRAAHIGREPRLIDINWDGGDGPTITLVGKGITFDTGGLDLKPSSAMLLMKKDMGGSAHALALGELIMRAGLNVKLRILLAVAENAVSGNAFRPGDILPTRAGTSVEIGNTDAEGRLVLCDALTLASEEKPDVIIDFATLTGAARVALGPDLPATFVNDESLWQAIESGAKDANDPVWRLPLYAGYNDMLKSDIADTGNVSAGGFGGAITAALYLQKFVGEGIKWAHLDTFAWNPSAKPGRPKGGEALGLRAIYQTLKSL